MTIAVSGRQFEISAGAVAATVTEAGAGLRTLHYGDKPLVDPYEADELPPGAHGQLLIPWPNRIDHGRYVFGGEQHQLDINEPESDNAIHGLVRWAPWRVREHQANRVKLTHRLHGHPGYPFVLDLSVTYAVEEQHGLRCRVSATNKGDTPAPYGNGTHPYLTAGTATIDECVLTVPGATRLPIDDRDLPVDREDVGATPYDFRAPRRLGQLWLNHAYTDLSRDDGGYAWVHVESPDATVSLWVDSTYPWLQLYTGDSLPQPDQRRTGLAVEPMTCPPNAFVSGEDVIVLQPGETVTSTWGIVSTRE